MTKIEWTDRTWNPVTGCTKVSPGCDGCYAETIAHRFAGSKAFPNGFDVTQHEARLSQPLRWRKPARVFVNSMSDLFHADIPDEFIARVFAVMALAPQHTFQVLTKRHARMRTLLGGPCKCGHQPGEHLRSKMAWAVSKANPDRIPGLPDDAEHRVYHETPWPLPNVWLGVSVENQRWADIRIPALLETPAAVRFLSCEPFLGPVDLFAGDHSDHERDFDGNDDYICLDCSTDDRHVPWRVIDRSNLGIDWVIVGGESGPKARAMHPDWARSLRDQCATANVPFFFKQHGEWGPAPFIVRVCDPQTGWHGTDEELAAAKADSEARGATHVHTGNWYEEKGERRYHLHEIGHKPWSLERCALPEGTAAIRRWGKKRAGRELDGRTHDAFPA
jgi:protein gp37